MPTILPAAPTGTARARALQNRGLTQDLVPRRIALSLVPGQMDRARLAALNQQFARLVQYQEARRARHEANSIGGAGIGGMAGAGVALGLAPFTGGASLAALPALTSVGSSIGGLADPSSFGPGTTRAVYAMQQGGQFMPNLFGPTAPDGGGMGIGASIDRANQGLGTADDLWADIAALAQGG